MNIFITGGMGFVGSHLSRHLNAKGHDLVIYDNFGNSELREPEIPNAKIIRGDVLDYSLLSDSMHGTDIVIHLAAQISVSESVRNPGFTIKANVDGTQNVLDACLKNNVKKFIALSSAAVFGESDRLLDEYSKASPMSPYGKSKLLMEQKLADFSKKHGINSVILRAFNIYGIGQSMQYAGVITKFLNQIKQDKPLEIFGTGKQTRDFVHIDDVVRCIDLAVQNIEGKYGEIYNIGSGTQTSILELAKTLLKLSEKKLPIDFKPEIPGEILHSHTSMQKAKTELGFEPKISLKEGLSRFLKNN